MSEIQQPQILATLLSNREVYDQFADTEFDSMQAVWIWRKVRDHVDRYDEIPDDAALRYYVDQESNEQLRSVLPTFLAQIKAVNVSAFQSDRIKGELAKRKQQRDLNRLIDASERGNYEDVLSDIASTVEHQ